MGSSSFKGAERGGGEVFMEIFSKSTFELFLIVIEGIEMYQLFN